MDLCEWWPSNIARRSGRLFVGCHVLGRACIVVEPFRPAELDACGACGIFLNLVYMYSPKVRHLKHEAGMNAWSDTYSKVYIFKEKTPKDKSNWPA